VRRRMEGGREGGREGRREGRRRVAFAKRRSRLMRVQMKKQGWIFWGCKEPLLPSFPPSLPLSPPRREREGGWEGGKVGWGKKAESSDEKAELDILGM